MALVFREAHAAPDKKKLNEEYFVLENTGGVAVSTGGLQVISGRKGKRGSLLGVIDPGFMLQPGEKIIVVCGSPGKKSHGEPPDARGACASTTCCSARACCTATGTMIRFTLNQMEIARLDYDAAAPDGIAAGRVLGPTPPCEAEVRSGTELEVASPSAATTSPMIVACATPRARSASTNASARSASSAMSRPPAVCGSSIKPARPASTPAATRTLGLVVRPGWWRSPWS